MIKDLTTAVSIPSGKNTFHHRMLLHSMGCQDLIRSMYGIHEVVLIVKYLRLVNSSMWVPHTSNFCFTLSFALVDVLIIDTTLLSSHCKARTGGSLSHRTAPLCLFFAHFLPPFKLATFSNLPGFKDGACVKDSLFIQVADKSDRRTEIITRKMILLALIVQHKFVIDIIP